MPARLRVIHRLSLPADVAPAQVGVTVGVAVLRRFAEPLERRSVALGNAFAAQEHQPEEGLGARVPLLGRFAVPLGSGPRVALDAHPARVTLPHVELPGRVALSGRLAEPLQGLRAVRRAGEAVAGDQPEENLRFRVAFLGGLADPTDALFRVAPHPAPLEVALTQLSLRPTDVLISQSLDPGEQLDLGRAPAQFHLPNGLLALVSNGHLERGSGREHG